MHTDVLTRHGISLFYLDVNGLLLLAVAETISWCWSSRLVPVYRVVAVLFQLEPSHPRPWIICTLENQTLPMNFSAKWCVCSWCSEFNWTVFPCMFIIVVFIFVEKCGHCCTTTIYPEVADNVFFFCIVLLYRSSLFRFLNKLVWPMGINRVVPLLPASVCYTATASKSSIASAVELESVKNSSFAASICFS